MDNWWGKSTLIDLKNCDLNIITSKRYIGDYVTQLCKLIDMNRYDDIQIVHFGNDENIAGFSFIQLIETSLLSGHFSNKNKTAYIDIFSCKDYDSTKAALFTQDFFKADSYDIQVVRR